MAIGYEKAKKLMAEEGYELLVTMSGESVEHIAVRKTDFSGQQTVRIDSGRRLVQECTVAGSLDYRTAIMHYGSESSDLQST